MHEENDFLRIYIDFYIRNLYKNFFVKYHSTVLDTSECRITVCYLHVIVAWIDMNDRTIYTDTSQIFTDIGNGIPFNGSSGGFHPKITVRKKLAHVDSFRSSSSMMDYG